MERVLRASVCLNGKLKKSLARNPDLNWYAELFRPMTQLESCSIFFQCLEVVLIPKRLSLVEPHTTQKARGNMKEEIGMGVQSVGVDVPHTCTDRIIDK
ncbi:hypothetical protein PM082_017590 [Marasmius tenuissimus]|nr:hypothetical protein PM082_017590 [Marasmius tenuissimus]